MAVLFLMNCKYHLDISILSRTGYDITKKRFRCDFTDCKKEFSLFKELKRHWVVHTGSRQFKCSYCNSLFGRNDHKIRHENKCRVASNFKITLDQSQSQTIKGDEDKGIANPYNLDTNQNPSKPIKALPTYDRTYQPSNIIYHLDLNFRESIQNQFLELQKLI